jgi:hypothetical protein
MPLYDILRWDCIQYHDAQDRPAIYLKPDQNLLDFLEKTQNITMIKIHSTNTLYDQINSPVYINFNRDKQDKPNYFSQTGQIMGVLPEVKWYGYPSQFSLGQIEFPNFDEPIINNEFQFKHDIINYGMYDITGINPKIFKYIKYVCLIFLVCILFRIVYVKRKIFLKLKNQIKYVFLSDF